jgi:plasmid stabilization system protein ParE
MARTIVYHPEFENDVRAAADWYGERHPDLETDFRNCLRAAVAELLHDPERSSPVDCGIRCWRTKRFPYVVFYDVSTRAIMLLGVMHTSQDSKK